MRIPSLIAAFVLIFGAASALLNPARAALEEDGYDTRALSEVLIYGNLEQAIVDLLVCKVDTMEHLHQKSHESLNLMLQVV